MYISSIPVGRNASRLRDWLESVSEDEARAIAAVQGPNWRLLVRQVITDDLNRAGTLGTPCQIADGPCWVEVYQSLPALPAAVPYRIGDAQVFAMRECHDCGAFGPCEPNDWNGRPFAMCGPCLEAEHDEVDEAWWLDSNGAFDLYVADRDDEYPDENTILAAGRDGW